MERRKRAIGELRDFDVIETLEAHRLGHTRLSELVRRAVHTLERSFRVGGRPPPQTGCELTFGVVSSRRPVRNDLDADAVAARVTGMRDELVAALRDETFDRVATRYRRDVIARDSRNVEPAEANQAAREALSDPELLVRLTHGKHLLAALRQAVQDEFNVSFGNQALIAEAAVDELDLELWTVLDEIEALAAG